MMKYRHAVNLEHERNPMVETIGEPPSAYGRVSVDAESEDLTEAVRELLSRMPNDLYAAFREAFQEVYAQEVDANMAADGA